MRTKASSQVSKIYSLLLLSLHFRLRPLWPAPTLKRHTNGPGRAAGLGHEGPPIFGTLFVSEFAPFGIRRGQILLSSGAAARGPLLLRAWRISGVQRKFSGEAKKYLWKRLYFCVRASNVDNSTMQIYTSNCMILGRISAQLRDCEKIGRNWPT